MRSVRSIRKTLATTAEAPRLGGITVTHPAFNLELRKVHSWVSQLAASKAGARVLSHLSGAFTTAIRCHILGWACSKPVAFFSVTTKGP